MPEIRVKMCAFLLEKLAANEAPSRIALDEIKWSYAKDVVDKVMEVSFALVTLQQN